MAIGDAYGGFLEAERQPASFGCIRLRVKERPENISTKVGVEWGGWRYAVPIWVEELPMVTNWLPMTSPAINRVAIIRDDRR